MKLKEAFDINFGEVISLVGGGGKTTLMFALAHELASNGSSVITTTTTKILEPLSSQTQFLLIVPEDRVIGALQQNLRSYKHITVATERLPLGKLKGVSPELVVSVSKLNQIDYIIVEGDGAAQRSLKVPSSTEPVIPPNSSLVIAVLGIDALGRELVEENVFRAELASRLTGLSLGQTVSMDAIVTLVTHPEGILKGSPTSARVILFINKVDLENSLPRARNLALKILEAKHPRLSRIVLGQAQLQNPVVEVVSNKNLA